MNGKPICKQRKGCHDKAIQKNIKLIYKKKVCHILPKYYTLSVVHKEKKECEDDDTFIIIH